MYGAIITIAGAVITVVLNIILIPQLHYLGAALATFACYLLMMIVSYILGQKYYPIPYARKKLLAYLLIATLVYLIHRGLLFIWDDFIFSILTATILMAAFAWFILQVEKAEFQKLPYIGRLLRSR